MKVWPVLLLVLSLALAHDEDDEEAVVVEEEIEEGGTRVERVEVEDIAYFSPESHPDHYFADHFDEVATLGAKWIRSQAKKEGADAAIAKYDGEWSIQALEKNPLTGEGLVHIPYRCADGFGTIHISVPSVRKVLIPYSVLVI